MHQWHYRSLRFFDTGLHLVEYYPNGITLQLLPAGDALIDDSPLTTLRRWIAQYGTEGWELVGILTDENGQPEPIFKQPVYPQP